VRGQGDIVDAVIAVVIVSIIVLIAFAIFDPLAQMGPQSGELGDANQSLTDAVATLPLTVGGIGLVIVIVGGLRVLGE